MQADLALGLLHLELVHNGPIRGLRRKRQFESLVEPFDQIVSLAVAIQGRLILVLHLGFFLSWCRG
jgi:hypothetical protein